MCKAAATWSTVSILRPSAAPHQQFAENEKNNHTNKKHPMRGAETTPKRWPRGLRAARRELVLEAEEVKEVQRAAAVAVSVAAAAAALDLLGDLEVIGACAADLAGDRAEEHIRLVERDKGSTLPGQRLGPAAGNPVVKDERKGRAVMETARRREARPRADWQRGGVDHEVNEW